MSHSEGQPSPSRVHGDAPGHHRGHTWPLFEDLAPAEQAEVLAGRRRGVIVPVSALEQLPSETREGALASLDAWVRTTICRPLPSLGRTSPLCPFVPNAVRKGQVRYAPVSGCRHPAEVEAAMVALVQRFERLWPRRGQDFPLDCVVAAFVDVASDDADRLVIGPHHERLKTYCVQRGLMLGEFAPGYFLAASANPATNVGEAPLPVLVLRHMVATDRRFLGTDPAWLAAYERHFPGLTGPCDRPPRHPSIHRGVCP